MMSSKKETPIRSSSQNFLLNKNALIQLQVRSKYAHWYKHHMGIHIVSKTECPLSLRYFLVHIYL